MCLLKKDRWKVVIALAGLLLLLVFMIWIPVSAANAYERTSESAPAVTVQATPTEDATMTALNKEQLTQQVNQLDHWWLYWLYNGSTAFIAAFATVLVAIVGIVQWRGNRDDEREKAEDAQDKELRERAEERFQTAVAALGNENEATQVGGAILLRSFLNKKDEKVYGRYYTQIFDLAVAYLRFRKTSDLRTDPVRQALVVVFKEAFPIVRNKLIADGAVREGAGALPSLDASRIQLDHASLRGADLKQIWMPQASLQEAILYGADLTEARLKYTALTGKKLLEALSLKGTDLRGVKRLTNEEIAACKAKGAFIDIHPRTGLPWPSVSPPPPSQSSNAQTP
jgi:hypothetical protein